MTVNDKVEEGAGKPLTYVSLERNWKAGDVIVLLLPASLRLEQAKDDSSMVSVFFGPALLAGELGREKMPKDVADKDAYLKNPPVPVPNFRMSPFSIADSWIYLLHGVLKFQRALSLLGSNLASVGVLPPTAVRARGSLELGTALGMMR